jgi:DNA repair exonuclease SbcCD nuclease subunit
MLRVAHLADVHLDSAFGQFGAAAQRKRQTAIEEALKKALQEARDRQANVLLIAGDLYEQRNFTANTADFLREQLGQFERPVFIAPGNHDHFNAKSLYATVAWSSNVHIFTEEKLVGVELEDGLRIWGAAHTVPATTTDFLDGFNVDGSGVHLAVFHGAEQSELSFVQQLRGDDERKEPYGPFRAEQISEAGLHHAFVGHIHTPRDAEFHTYPGNPEPLTFGETDSPRRGLVIAELDDSGRVTGRERVNVAQSAVRDLEISLDGCGNNSAIRDKVSSDLANATGFVRVTLTGEIGEAVEIDLNELRQLAPRNLDGVVLQTRELHVAYPIDKIATETGTIRGRFVEDVLASSELDEEEKQRVIVTGLRALHGRKDLAVA